MNKFAKWFIFGVVFATTPLLADYLTQSLHTQGVAFNWHEVITKGELLLVSAGIAGTAIGEVIGSGKSWLPFKLVAGGSCLIILLAAAILYSSIASDVRLQVVYNKQGLVSYSIWLFVGTLLASAGCIMVVEDK